LIPAGNAQIEINTGSFAKGFYLVKFGEFTQKFEVK
jgi:hypothetical protein